MTNALVRLLEIAPAPSEPRHKDWGEVERTLAVELPDDYRELIGVYGRSDWDDYLYVLEPDCPNKRYDLLKWAKWQFEDLESWKLFGRARRAQWLVCEKSRAGTSLRGRPCASGRKTNVGRNGTHARSAIPARFSGRYFSTSAVA
ncbi:hypothetical protein ACFVFI_09205 [Streptomyces sp. NPDC057705]|uniref:hypothetical protein n=1 Tax=Streptomyces sp. NPDC057705 TaxID=3346222 RepID=UPI0036CDDFFF